MALQKLWSSVQACNEFLGTLGISFGEWSPQIIACTLSGDDGQPCRAKGQDNKQSAYSLHIFIAAGRMQSTESTQHTETVIWLLSCSVVALPNSVHESRCLSSSTKSLKVTDIWKFLEGEILWKQCITFWGYSQSTSDILRNLLSTARIWQDVMFYECILAYQWYL